MDLSKCVASGTGMKIGKKPEKDWAKKAVAACDDIPVLTRPLKGTPLFHINCKIPEKMQRLAEEIRDEYERFKTMSDVYRAAIYVGISMIFEFMPCRSQADKNRLELLFKLFKANEEYNQNMLALDHVVDIAFQKKRQLHAGIITRHDLDEFVGYVLELLPVSLHKPAMKKINQVMDGITPNNLYECSCDKKTKEL